MSDLNTRPINFNYNSNKIPIKTGTSSFNRPINIVVRSSEQVGNIEETNGLSAYQLAVINGFVGTVQQWLTSLHGSAAINRGFPFTQTTPSAAWTVNHKLGYNPSATCFDDTGDTIIGEVQYLNTDSLIIIYSKRVAGTAFFS